MPPVIALTSLIFSTRPANGGCWLSTLVSVAVATSTRPTPQARWESGSPKLWGMFNQCRPAHGAGVSTFTGTSCTIICQMFLLLFLGLKMWSKQSDMSRFGVSLWIVWYCVSLGMGAEGTSKGHFDHWIASFIIYRTPSLPQPVKFPGWMMHGCACKQYIFRSNNIYFQCYVFWWKSFHMPVWKRRQKGLRMSN